MDANAPRWGAVVVNYHSGPVLAESVDALLRDDSGGPGEIVVVDNGSAAGEMDALIATRPSVTVLHPGANLGYARAANLGIAATTAPIVAVINSDAIVEAGTAAVVLARFDADPRVAVVGPCITNPDGTVYPSARTAPGVGAAVGHAILGGVAPRNRFTRAYRQLDADPAVGRNVDWVSGAAMWIRRSALDHVGGWDERFFFFMEDIDLCRTIRATGATVRYEPAARVMHEVGTSRASAPTRSIVMHHRAAYRYTRKWSTGPRRWILPAAGAFLAGRAGVQIVAGVVDRRCARRRPELRVATR